MVFKHYQSGVDFLNDQQSLKLLTTARSKTTTTKKRKRSHSRKRNNVKSPTSLTSTSTSSLKVSKKDGADWIRHLQQLIEVQGLGNYGQQQRLSSITTAVTTTSSKSSSKTTRSISNDNPLWSLLFGLNSSSSSPVTSKSPSKSYHKPQSVTSKSSDCADLMWRFWKWNSSPHAPSRSSSKSSHSGSFDDLRLSGSSIRDLLLRANVSSSSEDDNNNNQGFIGKSLYFVNRFKNNLNQSSEHLYSTNQLKQLVILEYPDIFRYVTDDNNVAEDNLKRVSSTSMLFGEGGSGSGLSGASGEARTTIYARSTRSYFIFKNGVPPLWEDEYNAAGGCWNLLLDSNAHTDLSPRYIWKLMMKLIIDDRMKNYLEDICGFGLSIKSNGMYKITVWNRDSDNTIVNMMIGQLLKSLINLPTVSMSYYSHKSTIRKVYRQSQNRHQQQQQHNGQINSNSNYYHQGHQVPSGPQSNSNRRLSSTSRNDFYRPLSSSQSSPPPQSQSLRYRNQNQSNRFGFQGSLDNLIENPDEDDDEDEDEEDLHSNPSNYSNLRHNSPQPQIPQSPTNWFSNDSHYNNHRYRSSNSLPSWSSSFDQSFPWLSRIWNYNEDNHQDVDGDDDDDWVQNDHSSRLNVPESLSQFYPLNNQSNNNLNQYRPYSSNYHNNQNQFSQRSQFNSTSFSSNSFNSNHNNYNNRNNYQNQQPHFAANNFNNRNRNYHSSNYQNNNRY